MEEIMLTERKMGRKPINLETYRFIDALNMFLKRYLDPAKVNNCDFEIKPGEGENEKIVFASIKCSNKETLWEIARVLENSSYYSKRIKVSDNRLIKVSSWEKDETSKNLLIVKKFFIWLKNLLGEEKSPTKIEIPAIVVASSDSSDIVLKLTDLSLLDKFTSKLKEYEIIYEVTKINKDERAITLSIKMEKIKKIVAGETLIEAPQTFIEAEEIFYKPKPLPAQPKRKPPPEKKPIRSMVEIPQPRNYEKPTVKVVEKAPEIKTESLREGFPVDIPVPNFVYQSMEYEKFHCLPFNRKIKWSHVGNLVRSMNIHGPDLSIATVVDTDCVDGVLRRYYVDGQHRAKAWEKRGDPILYTIRKANSVEELVQLISDLNKTSKNWTLREYLYVWSSLKIKTYRVIEKYLRNTKLPITLLLEIFSGVGRSAASKMLQRGKLKIKDIKTARKHVEWICELKGFLPKSREVLSALVILFRKIEDYDNEKMEIALGKSSKTNIFTPGEKTDEIIIKLEKLYFDRVA